MASLQIEVRNLSGVTRKFDRLAALTGNLHPLMLRISAALTRTVAQTFREEKDPKTGAAWKKTGALALANRPGGGGRGKTLRDTARLMQSLLARPPAVTGGARSPAIKFSTAGVVYAAAHQQSFTGPMTRTLTIRPKNAKMLAIPITREAARAHGARRFISQHQGQTFFAKRMIFLREGKKITPQFLLRKEVKIPQRRFLGWGKAQSETADRLILGEIRRAMAGQGAA
jgi:phage gpG-like protein